VIIDKILSNTSKNISRLEITSLFILVVIATVVRLLAIFFIPDSLTIDNPTYQKAAADLIDTGVISNHYIMPMYPLLLAFLGGGTFSEVIVGVVSSAITLILIWQLSKHIFEDKYVGLIAAFIFSLYPMSIFYGVKGLTESPFLVFLLAGFVFLYKNNIVASSIFFVLTILTRPVTDLFAPFVIFWYIFFVKKEGVFSAIKSLSIYSFIYVIMMSPWWLHNYNKHDEFVRLSLGYGVVLYAGNNHMNISGGGIGDKDYNAAIMDGYKDPIKKDIFLRNAATKFIVDNPGHFVEMMWVKFKRIWGLLPYNAEINNNFMAIVTTISLLPMLLGALYTIIIRRDIFLYLTPLLGFVAYLTLVHMITIGSIRYRYPMEVIFIIFSAPFISRIFNQWIK